jgi:hypothetical protein
VVRHCGPKSVAEPAEPDNDRRPRRRWMASCIAFIVATLGRRLMGGPTNRPRRRNTAYPRRPRIPGTPMNSPKPSNRIHRSRSDGKHLSPTPPHRSKSTRRNNTETGGRSGWRPYRRFAHRCATGMTRLTVYARFGCGRCGAAVKVSNAGAEAPARFPFMNARFPFMNVRRAILDSDPF